MSLKNKLKRFACIAFTFRPPVGNFAGRGEMGLHFFSGGKSRCVMKHEFHSVSGRGRRYDEPGVIARGAMKPPVVAAWFQKDSRLMALNSLSLQNISNFCFFTKKIVKILIYWHIKNTRKKLMEAGSIAYSRFAASDHSFMCFSIDANRLNMKAINFEGKVLYETELKKA